MTPNEKFFHTHAGWSYDPAKETSDQGRIRCAQQLAFAESRLLEAMRVADVGVTWDEDQMEGAEQAAIWHRDENGKCTHLAALGGIIDATKAYRRVVRAELALECVEELAKLGHVT